MAKNIYAKQIKIFFIGAIGLTFIFIASLFVSIVVNYIFYSVDVDYIIYALYRILPIYIGFLFLLILYNVVVILVKNYSYAHILDKRKIKKEAFIAWSRKSLFESDKNNEN
ncbi:MAG: hypothetical protein ACK41P_04505 [Asticcacaulis sp.]